MSNAFSSQISPDDNLWTFSTNKVEDMVSLFENPYEWVSKTTGKVLANHFVMQFMPFDKLQASGNSFVVQGIDYTALITVRYSPADVAAQLAAAGLLRTSGELDSFSDTAQIRLRTDFGLAYLHWEWGSDPQAAGLKLLQAASDVPAFLGELSALNQMIDTETATQAPTPIEGVHINFVMPMMGPQGITFVYQGMSEWFQTSGGGPVEGGDPPPPPPDPTLCNMELGTFEGDPEAETDVEVNTIIVKAYVDEGP